MVIPIALSFFVVSIAYVVAEDEGTKVQLLLVSAPRLVQWLSTLLYDSAQYLLAYGMPVFSAPLRLVCK